MDEGDNVFSTHLHVPNLWWTAGRSGNDITAVLSQDTAIDLQVIRGIDVRTSVHLLFHHCEVIPFGKNSCIGLKPAQTLKLSNYRETHNPSFLSSGCLHTTNLPVGNVNLAVLAKDVARFRLTPSSEKRGTTCGNRREGSLEKEKKVVRLSLIG